MRQLIVGTLVGDEAFQRGQIHRIVHSGTRARSGAGVRANPAADGGQRVVAQNDLERFFKALLRDQSHITLSVLMNGARSLAGSDTAARDGEDVGDGLRERPVDRLPLSQPLIKLGGQRYRTLRRARAATRTFRRVHKTRLLLDADREIPRLPIDALHLAQGENVDVLVPADLDQTRRHGAHRAIVGGKSFVELRHDPANSRAAFAQIHLDAAVGQIEGRLHAADTASHDQGSTYRWGFRVLRPHGEQPPPRAPAARLFP